MCERNNRSKNITSSKKVDCASETFLIIQISALQGLGEAEGMEEMVN